MKLILQPRRQMGQIRYEAEKMKEKCTENNAGQTKCINYQRNKLCGYEQAFELIQPPNLNSEAINYFVTDCFHKSRKLQEMLTSLQDYYNYTNKLC